MMARVQTQWLAFNPHQCAAPRNVRLNTCSLCDRLTRAGVPEVVDHIARHEDEVGVGRYFGVQQIGLALPPSSCVVSNLVAALNERSVPLRRGRWLRVLATGAPQPSHVVVVWDANGDPVASPGDELHCTCGFPVTITATDVVCASGHPIDAAV